MSDIARLVAELEEGSLDLASFLAKNPSIPREDQIQLVLADQKHHLNLGEPCCFEHYADRFSWLTEAPSHAVRIIASEFTLRLGTQGAAELFQELMKRYSNFGSSLENQLRTALDAWNTRPLSTDDFDRICDRFEEQITEGPQPLIEDWLARAPKVSRSDLLREMLRVETYHRQCSGSLLDWNGYHRRFPEDQELIQQVQREFDSTPGSPAHGWFSTQFLPRQAIRKSLMESPARPKVLGDYELLKPLGQGGMGTVFLAKHVKLGRLVALKTLSRGNLSNSQEVARFRAEAESAANLDHPNIASIYEIGESDGTSFIAMQWIDGQSLDAWRAKETLSPKIVAAKVRDIARAMAYAHSQGVIHRDLKPGNVMIDAASAIRIVDFGLAKKMDSEWQMTITGQVMGTPSFMAPEQAAGDSKNVTELADVYAIGAILFYLLTGKPPFVGVTMYDTLDQVRNSPAPSARTYNPRLPLDLCTVCAKCLEKSPGQRYASATQLAEDLDRFLNNQPILARRISTTTRMLRWCRRNPLPTAFMTFMTIMLGLTTYLYRQANWAREDAQKSSLAAQKSSREQLRTVNELAVKIANDLKNVPHSSKIRSDLLSKALEIFKEIKSTGNQSGNLDDLRVLTAKLKAEIEGKLADEGKSTDDPLAALEKAEKDLRTILDHPAANRISLDEAIDVYGVTDVEKNWFRNLQAKLPEEILVRSIRELALSDNLNIQQSLLQHDPHKQIAIAEKVLHIREKVCLDLGNDPEAEGRLANAHQNLAEAMRDDSKEPDKEKLEKLILHIDTATQIREKIREKLREDNGLYRSLRCEMAKGKIVRARALQEKLNFTLPTLGSNESNPTSTDELQQQIKDLFCEALEEFGNLADPSSPDYAEDLYRDVSYHQAIVYRALADLDIESCDWVMEGDDRRENCYQSCQLLTKLCESYPLEEIYQRELLISQRSWCRIVHKYQRARKVKGFDAYAPKEYAEEYYVLKYLSNDFLNKGEKLAEKNPSACMKSYLALAREALLITLVFDEPRDAVAIANKALEVYGKDINSEIGDPETQELIKSIELDLELLVKESVVPASEGLNKTESEGR